MLEPEDDDVVPEVPLLVAPEAPLLDVVVPLEPLEPLEAVPPLADEALEPDAPLVPDDAPSLNNPVSVAPPHAARQAPDTRATDPSKDNVFMALQL